MSLSVPSASVPTSPTSQSFTPPTLSSGASWTRQDKELLRHKWKEFKGDWDQIQTCFPKRTLKALTLCWNRLNPSSNGIKGQSAKKWSKYPSLDFMEQLKQGVEESNYLKGRIDWHLVASKTDGKTPYQCRYNYENYVDPSFYKGDWTPEEDAILLEINKDPKVSFTKIAAVIKEKIGFKRTYWNIHNRWERLTRNSSKLKRKRRNAEGKIEGLNSEELKDPPSKKIKIEEESDSISTPDYSLSVLDSAVPTSPIHQSTPQKENNGISLDVFEQQPVTEGDENLMQVEDSPIEESYENVIDQIFQEMLSSFLKDNEIPISPLPLMNQEWLGEEMYTLPFGNQLLDVAEDTRFLYED